jgi:ferredoxin/DMSO/TMAO reductase YedYZ heme-binding membrane subunit
MLAIRTRDGHRNWQPRAFVVSVTAEAFILAGAIDPHDAGVRQIAAFSARLAYLFMCLTLCWGVLTATGLVRHVTGYQALRSGHMMLSAFTLATAGVHGLSFLFLDEDVLRGLQVLVPLLNGEVRHALGIIAFELMIAIAVTTGFQRLFRYRAWLRIHQLAYIAVVFGVAHSWFGLWTNGNVDRWWVGGTTVAAPVLALSFVRWVPPSVLAKMRIIDGEPVHIKRLNTTEQIIVSVDNRKCHRYGFCQTEAPDVFQLRDDGRLQFRKHPEVTRNLDVRSAARSCPMRAIHLQGANK